MPSSKVTPVPGGESPLVKYAFEAVVELEDTVARLADALTEGSSLRKEVATLKAEKEQLRAQLDKHPKAEQHPGTGAGAKEPSIELPLEQATADRPAPAPGPAPGANPDLKAENERLLMELATLKVKSAAREAENERLNVEVAARKLQNAARTAAAKETHPAYKAVIERLKSQSSLQTAEILRLSKQLAQVTGKTTASDQPEAKTEEDHDAPLPPELKAWEPVAKTAAVMEVASRELCRRLEGEFAICPTGAPAEQLRSKTAELAATLRRVIDERVREDRIVARSDGAIKAGADTFTDVYDGVTKSIEMTEEAGMKTMSKELSEERKAERVGRNGEEAKQTKSDVIGVYTDAAAVRPLATAVVARIAASCGVTQPSEPVRLKSIVRILEKAQLRPGDARGQCERVCDIVRDMVVGDSAAQLAQLVRAFFDDDEIVVVRLKDRFKHPPPGGWRDVMVRSPHTCEKSVPRAACRSSQIRLLTTQATAPPVTAADQLLRGRRRQQARVRGAAGTQVVADGSQGAARARYLRCREKRN